MHTPVKPGSIPVAASRLSIPTVLPSLVLAAALAGCQAIDPSSDPRTIPTFGGGTATTITCESNIFAIGESGCRRSVLAKCKPGATILNVETSSRPVYTPNGYMTGSVRTYFIKDCT